MKILLIGASSDIACDLYDKYKNQYDFIRLSSDNNYSDVENFNIQDTNTYIDLDHIDGLVYFPGTIVLKPFKQLRLNLLKNPFKQTIC